MPNNKASPKWRERSRHGGKAKDWFTFSCSPALVRLFIAPLEQESFCKWTIIKSDLCRTRKLINFKSILACLPLSCSHFVDGFQAQIPKVFRRTVTANKTTSNVKFTTKHSRQKCRFLEWFRPCCKHYNRARAKRSISKTIDPYRLSKKKDYRSFASSLHSQNNQPLKFYSPHLPASIC